MGPVGSDGYLTQNVGDNSTLYSISFWLKNDGGTPNDFTLFWNNTNVGPSLVNVSAFDYTQFSYTLPGNVGAGSNTLSFQFRQDPGGWELDDIVVRNVGSIPEPGSLILFGSGILGFAGMGWKSRGKSCRLISQ